MTGPLRRLRGLLGIGVTWGALWSGIGAAIGLVIGLVSPEAWGWTHPVIEWAIGMGLYGLVSGVGFGGLLALREGRKTLLELSHRRAAVWGVLGAAGVPLLFGALGMFEVGTTMAEILGAALVTGVLGGTVAPASVAIARGAELRGRTDRGRLGPQTSSEAGQGVIEVG